MKVDVYVDEMEGESCYFTSRMFEAFFMAQRTMVQMPMNNGAMSHE